MVGSSLHFTRFDFPWSLWLILRPHGMFACTVSMEVTQCVLSSIRNGVGASHSVIDDNDGMHCGRWPTVVSFALSSNILFC